MNLKKRYLNIHKVKQMRYFRERKDMSDRKRLRIKLENLGKRMDNNPTDEEFKKGVLILLLFIGVVLASLCVGFLMFDGVVALVVSVVSFLVFVEWVFVKVGLRVV